MKAFFFEARGGLVIIHLRLVTCECLYFGIATSFLGRSGETVQRRIAKFLLVITKHHITTMLRMFCVNCQVKTTSRLLFSFR